MQDDLAVSDKKITGTLKYIEDGLSPSGPLSGSGNFMALKFDADDWDAYTSVKVGLVPSSSGMDLVEIIDDPDKNGVFKVSGEVDGVQQVFKVVSTDGTYTKTDVYDLSDLVLEDDGV
jgi:hypothetical protein